MDDLDALGIAELPPHGHRSGWKPEVMVGTLRSLLMATGAGHRMRGAAIAVTFYAAIRSTTAVSRMRVPF